MKHQLCRSSRRIILPLILAALSVMSSLSAREANSQTETARAAAAAATTGALLVLNKVDNTLAIVDASSLKVVAKVPTGEGPHEAITSSDGKLVYVANYGAQQPGSSISVIDIAARKEVKRVDLGALKRPHGMVEMGGHIYFTSEVARVVARYNPAADRVDWIMGTGQTGTHMLVISPDQKRLYTANIPSDTVTAIDLGAPPGPVQIAQVTVGRMPEGLDISPDGRELWVGHNGDGGLSIIDTTTRKVKETLPKIVEMPIRVKFTPDGKRVLVSDPRGNEVVVIDAATRKEIKRLKVDGSPVGILVPRDGRRAYIAASESGKVSVIDLESLAITGTVETGNGPDGLAWSER